jgi:hypothetical protein
MIRLFISATGKITGIKGDTLMIKNRTGKVQIMSAQPSQLTGLKVGDNVRVEMRNGRVVAINKAKDSWNSNYQTTNEQESSQADGRSGSHGSNYHH